MLGPSRPVPRVGASVRIVHFGGEFERGTIVALLDEGRHVQVRGADGRLHEFVLNLANAQFVAAADSHGSRLELFS
jgi:hypothetical protein